MNNSYLIAEEFVEAWQTAKSMDELAKKFNRSQRALAQKATYFRRIGIPLKHFKAGRKFDAEKLKKIALKYTPK